MLFLDISQEELAQPTRTSGSSTSYRNDAKIKAIAEVRRALGMYIDGCDILALPAYKLQASRFQDGMVVHVAQGLQRSVIVYGVTEYAYRR